MSLDHDMTDLVQRGTRQLNAAQYGLAAESFLEAANRTEVPDSEVCVQIARALLKDRRPAEAAAWAVRAVDGGDVFRAWLAAAGLLGRCPPETWPQVRRRLRLSVVGTWTTNAFAPLLQLALARLGIAATLHEAGFGQ
jgi:hypothetical protein